MQKCSRCNIAHYCSRQCQRNDWQGHSTECGRLQLWSSHIIKTCRKPGNSDATTIEEALVQSVKSAIFDHVKTYEQTDLSLRLQQQHQDTTWRCPWWCYGQRQALWAEWLHLWLAPCRLNLPSVHLLNLALETTNGKKYIHLLSLMCLLWNGHRPGQVDGPLCGLHMLF